MVSIHLHFILARVTAQGIIVLIIFATPFAIALIYSFLGSLKAGLELFHEMAVKSGAVHYSASTTENVPQHLAMFPYYQKLSIAGKQKFVRRILNFMSIKTFGGADDYEPDYAAKIHIAAAATQLTFGLPDFPFERFDTFILYPTIFKLGEKGPLMKGATTPNGIVRISIKDFDEGFKNPFDKLNVGLHELGHALFMEFLGEVSTEQHGDYFHPVSNVVHPYLLEADKLLKSGKDHDNFLRHYAFTNRHEFFAVCTEHFFEAPMEFKEKLPVLFKLMAALLNQDPNNVSNDYALQTKV